jgi:hypothetical protein
MRTASGAFAASASRAAASNRLSGSTPATLPTGGDRAPPPGGPAGQPEHLADIDAARAGYDARVAAEAAAFD